MENTGTTVYTIVATSVDTDRASFPDPEAKGSFLSPVRAREELERLIAEEKETLDDRYDKEDRGEDYWEAYMDGYAAALFSRLDILSSELCCEGGTLK